MQEHTRRHQRMSDSQPRGRVLPLSIGSLFVSAQAANRSTVPLVIQFHGPEWLAASAATRWKKRVAVIAIQLGAGSGVYARAFADPARFPDLLAEAAHVSGLEFNPLVIASFSAGYGAVREILNNRSNWHRIDAIILEDSLHTSYLPEGRPGPLDTAKLQLFLDFAREAAAGHKRMLITNSEVFPGTFASTTETTDYIAAQLGLVRTPVLKWGPGGMQQLSETRQGRFLLLGFAGNSGPDHIDHLHGLYDWLRRLPR